MNALEPSAPSKQQNPLAAIKTKLIQLHDSLASFLEMPQNVPWPIVLGQFNSLIAKYESIMGDLQIPVIPLKQLIVAPQVLPPADPDFVPRVLLRTRLDQELFDVEEKLRTAHALVCTLAPEKTVNALDQVALKKELQGWVSLVDAHDEVANHAASHLDDIMDETLKELKRRLPEDAKETISSTQLQSKLEETVRWISIGK
ncbi:hypothetical protein BCR33DRAFT_712739 [Rhizoclosmatium globosum]|uniref:Mediator of RNA polymerase II transcription subunit 8 n=1 Tax=Rhizoclosmatium globosum TaxID=329046 RepID=A0A1Y2CUM1_9FUNG|nr:hypothetical protein BCR33DRAFT_712739 [Rhizoclosmatium globosum]|eukprot:ORY50748.1 hypothetical protein BCR33DRAFT_712739 [Rhizoclosmatium globosum]